MIVLFAMAAAAGVDPVALEKMRAFGSCVVANSPKRAGAVLALDVNSDEYQRRLRLLLDDNRQCIGRGSIGSQHVLFAGSLAEALLKSGKVGKQALWMTQAAQGLPEPRGPLEKMALCTVAAAPKESAALLATTLGTPEEMAAVQPLVPHLATCAPPTLQLTANQSSVRALIALAAWRIASTSKESAAR
jgi:hypothetical protein